MVYICDFQIIRPKNEVPQETTLQWLLDAHSAAKKREGHGDLPPSFQKLLWKIGLGEGKINNRGVYFLDILEKAVNGDGFTARTELYDQAVTEIFENFYPIGAPIPSHLVHVTCTGYTSPSGAQKIVSKRAQKNKTAVTHAYHMGCYGSMPAIRIAGNEPTDIVHTEMCSLHLNPYLHDLEQMVIQTLFADGFIKYSLREAKKGLKVLALHEEIIPVTMDLMTWGCRDWGLGMTLSKEVPQAISGSVVGFLEELSEKAGLDYKDASKSAFFAIHPGGPKIIEQIAALLKLDAPQIEHSKQILQSYGNMSSATLPHVWEKMNRELPDGSLIYSMAFGPGLTISGALFRKES